MPFGDPVPFSDPVFFARPADVVAADLLGAVLHVRGTDGVIVETEAYTDGPFI